MERYGVVELRGARAYASSLKALSMRSISASCEVSLWSAKLREKGGEPC